MERDMSISRLVSQTELSKVVGVSVDKIRDWREQGLPFLRVGRDVFFHEQELVEWMLENLRGSLAKPSR